MSDSLPLAALERIDDRCESFVADWNRGAVPQLEAYLVGEEGAARHRLLVDLLRQEIAFHRQNNRNPMRDGYLQRFPDDRNSVMEAFDLEDKHEVESGEATVTIASTEGLQGERVQYVGDYELQEEIGRGGMGVVYRAKQKSLKRMVALKMILSGRFASPDELSRFQREAEAAAQLEHRGIVPIHEIGEHGGLQYYSMTLIEGQSLKERIADTPLGPKEAARFMVQIAEAVDFAHKRGVIHRDLKPANILIDEDDVPHVSDFGLARQLNEGSETLTGEVLGTPSYMSPEQAKGKHRIVGVTSDVYSLGTVLYAMLTGRPPFQAESSHDVLLQVAQNDIVEPRRLNTAIPTELETICLKCLRTKPEQRYATAKELADDLNRWLERRPIQARRVGDLKKAYLWCRRNPAQLFFTAFVVSIIAFSVHARYQYMLRQNDLLLNQMPLLQKAVGVTVQRFSQDESNNFAQTGSSSGVPVGTSGDINFITKYSQRVVRFGSDSVKRFAARTILDLEPIKDQLEDPSFEELLRDVLKFTNDERQKEKIRQFLDLQ